jgi:hypothetical protein
VKQVEGRVKSEIENIQREKEKNEMYAKQLESLNEQLRQELSKRPSHLINSVRLSTKSFIT